MFSWDLQKAVTLPDAFDQSRFEAIRAISIVFRLFEAIQLLNVTEHRSKASDALLEAHVDVI